MKNKTTTLLAVTLITLLTAGQSAMAGNEDTSGYEALIGTANSSQSMVVTASFMQRDTVIGNSENGVDPAYLGGTYDAPFMSKGGYGAESSVASLIYANDTNK